MSWFLHAITLDGFESYVTSTTFSALSGAKGVGEGGGGGGGDSNVRDEKESPKLFNVLSSVESRDPSFIIRSSSLNVNGGEAGGAGGEAGGAGGGAGGGNSSLKKRLLTSVTSGGVTVVPVNEFVLVKHPYVLLSGTRVERVR